MWVLGFTQAFNLGGVVQLMEINYSEMRLNKICSSLHTDFLNVRTRQCQISVVSLARSSNGKKWM